MEWAPSWESESWERGQRSPSKHPRPEWAEYHRLVAVGSDENERRLVVATQIGRHPVAKLASFQALVLREGQDPVVISENEIALSTTWEFRTSGLWADHVCEDPYHHWSYGLEAFALEIDNPVELLGRAFGYRVPLGWALDVVGTETPVSAYAPTAASGCYRQAGRATGELLFADGEVQLDGDAQRWHAWGPRPLAGIDTNVGDAGQVDLGDGQAIALPASGGVWWVAQSEAGVRSRSVG